MSVKPVYTVCKQWGETPLECLERLRTEENIPADVPMTYAGRLDPAAEGELLILVGDECKKKDAYNKRVKTYTAEILFGVSTDSYDLLGMPKIENSPAGDVEKYLKAHLGKQTQKYPPYSSKTVKGIQLHTHARKGNAVEAPMHEVELFGYSELKAGMRRCEDVLVRVRDLTDIVTGDFRQKEIVKAWTALASGMPDAFPIISVTLTVSSGFYIRQLAEDLGRALGGGACLYSLIRTKIGDGTN